MALARRGGREFRWAAPWERYSGHQRRSPSDSSEESAGVVDFGELPLPQEPGGLADPSHEARVPLLSQVASMLCSVCDAWRALNSPSESG